MQRDVRTPSAYRKAVAADSSDELLRTFDAVRKAVRAAAPKLKEGLEYGMLDYPGFANLGVQKNYVALYVAPPVLAKHKKNFPGTRAGKSCLRFTKKEQVDADALAALLEAVLKYRGI